MSGGTDSGVPGSSPVGAICPSFFLFFSFHFFLKFFFFFVFRYVDCFMFLMLMFFSVISIFNHVPRPFPLARTKLYLLTFTGYRVIFVFEWEHCTVTIRYGYSRNFECFYRNYDTGTATIRYGKFPSHTKTTLYLTIRLRVRVFYRLILCWRGRSPSQL